MSAVAAPHVRVEVARLLRRRRCWFLLASTAALVVLFGYVLLSAVAELAAADPQLSEASRAEVAARAAGTRLADLPAALGQVTGQFVPVLGLLSGALLLGEDYRRGFLKLLVARGVPRRALVLSKLVAAAAPALLGTAAAVLGAVAGSLLVSGAGGPAPSVGPLLLVAAATALTWWLWAVLGLLLTAAARSAVAAVAGAGVLLLAGSALGALAGRDDLLGAVARVLPLGLTTRALDAASAANPARTVPLLAAVLLSAALAGWAATSVVARQGLR